MEPFHLFRYLDEQAYRFNERKRNHGERFLNAIRGVIGKRLPDKELLGNLRDLKNDKPMCDDIPIEPPPMFYEIEALVQSRIEDPCLIPAK